ncbi:MAG: hypothetical protein QOJ52_1551 [Acidimicrobiaceae bacterium]|jgi:hypothetical protein|nr:hypothetical protein [Acidimicrobiaceae bacterium]MDQ1415176.1 hypothetical protein [Acidimicrobiaceae bacterium]MDQ1419589.1 hypothetical protein [Acidimicrobiaceae bacterium]MDQ1442320.1 hypothetical protein [Acidimicrobiaceae bacterium]
MSELVSPLAPLPTTTDSAVARTLLNLLSGAAVAQAVSVVARLGVADALASGPLAVDDLAEKLGADAPTLYRLLRGVAEVGLVVEEDGRRFALAPMGDLLRCDSGGAVRAFATMVGMAFHRDAWTGLYDAVRTGELPFARVHGAPLFEYLADHPDDGCVFDAAMLVTTVAYGPITEIYDFGRFRNIVDVGGGRGHVLASILSAHPASRGVLFDRPEVVADAPPLLASSGVAGRCQVVAGDFFESVPAGGDAYLLANIVHDWDDTGALRILRSCSRSMSGAARLILFEGILSDAPGGALSRLADLELLVVGPGGRLRSPADYQGLFEQSGFHLDEVVAGGPAAVITARLSDGS